jgi:hypothetical protein
MRRRHWAPYTLALWTLLVWGTRLKNADGSVFAILGSLVFLVLAAIVLGTRGHAIPTITLGGLTVFVWLVRLPMIVLFSDRSASFKAVHAVIGVISILLAGACDEAFSGRKEQVAPAPEQG